MLSAQRRDEIKKILLARKNITVIEMAEHFSVSTETIRRDFDYLSNQGFLDKFYGGATLKTRVANVVSQQVKSGILVENKKRMAKAAASMVKPGDCIFLDHSTSVYEICAALQNMPLTIMSNSLAVISFFFRNPNVKLVCAGGNFDMNAQGFFGLETVEFIKRHYLDKAFFSCRSLDEKHGLCDTEEQTAALRRTVIGQAASSYLLADHTKLGKPSFISISDFRPIDCLITDTVLSEEWKSFFSSKDMQVVECPE